MVRCDGDHKRVQPLDGKYMADMPAEPLALSAPLALGYATRLCRSGLAGVEGCFWYHGVWQYLCLLGLASAPDRHAVFFGSSFENLGVEGGFSRVLISGSADYSMLAYLAQTHGRARITVVDCCETPLSLCRWYAKRMSQKIEMQRAQILDYRPDRAFDMICTHSFLSRFPATGRENLMKTWHGALRPGGMLVTSTRLNPSWSEDKAGFSPGQVMAFGERALAEAEARPGLIDLASEDIARFARHYAALFRNYSLRMEEELRQLLERGGFAIEHLGIRELEGSFAAGGPGTSQTASYAEIIARRV